MKRVGKLIFLLVVSAVVTACSTSDLSYRNNALVLQIDGRSLQMESRVVGERMENFGTLSVRQQLLQKRDGTLLVYEKARTDDRYEFYLPTVDTIRIVFDARDVHVFYFSHSVYMMQLLLADGSVLNLMAEQLEDQSLNMVYGMSNKEMNRLLGQLGTEARLPEAGHVVRLAKGSGAVLSRWTTYKVSIIPLVGPLRDLFGF
jgi:hypothetical protein